MVSDKNINLSSITESDEELIELQVSRIIASPHFKSAPQMQRFLEYIIDKAVAGEHRELKQYTIAVEALGFPDDFDSDSNPAVRIMGGRVRERLHKYYQEEGKNEPLLISIPKGNYIPVIQRSATDNTTLVSHGGESQGPKLGLFCFDGDTQSKESNLLLAHISSTLAKELSHFIFSRLYVQIPYLGEARSDLIGHRAKEKYRIDFTLLLYVQELPDNKYELVYRLWDNGSEEVISSEIFNVYHGQPENEQNNILNKISAVVADFYQGKLHLYWGRKLLNDEASIPDSYETLAYYRYYADHQGRDAFEKAVFYCLKALERNPQDIVANVIYADYCRRDYVYSFNIIESSLKTGKKCAEMAIRLRPDSHEAHFVMGQILFCMNEWAHSTSEFNLARRISKYHTVIEYGTGFHFCLMGRWEEGLLLTEKAMSLSDSYPDWYHLTPFLNYYRNEKYSEALTEALKITTPNILHGPMARSAVYGQLGDIENAHKELQSLLTRCPDFLETGKETLIRFLGTEELAGKIWDGLMKAKKNA